MRSRSRIWTMEVDSFGAIINRVNSLWTLPRVEEDRAGFLKSLQAALSDWELLL